MKKDQVLAARKGQERRLWVPMTLTPIGKLDAIRGETGSKADGSIFKMSDVALKREIRSLSGALGRLKAIRTA